jgi:hypothetical protein
MQHLLSETVELGQRGPISHCHKHKNHHRNSHRIETWNQTKVDLPPKSQCKDTWDEKRTAKFCWTNFTQRNLMLNLNSEMFIMALACKCLCSCQCNNTFLNLSWWSTKYNWRFHKTTTQCTASAVTGKP